MKTIVQIQHIHTASDPKADVLQKLFSYETMELIAIAAQHVADPKEIATTLFIE